MELVDNLLFEFEKDWRTLDIFVDLSKAFEKLNHKINLKNLSFIV